MSKLSPNLKRYTIDETVSIMDSRANFNGRVIMHVQDAAHLMWKILVQIKEDNKTPVEFNLYGELREGIDEEESEVEEG